MSNAGWDVTWVGSRIFALPCCCNVSFSSLSTHFYLLQLLQPLVLQLIHWKSHLPQPGKKHSISKYIHKELAKTSILMCN